MLVARNAEALGQAVREIEAAGGDADHAVADVGAPEDVAAAKALSRWGRIDIWVNNAGTGIYPKLTDTPLDEHERLFRRNYFGVVNGTMAALPHLRESRGALGHRRLARLRHPLADPRCLHSIQARREGFIESLRMEPEADGVPVAVTLVKPSGIDTPVAQRATSTTRR